MDTQASYSEEKYIGELKDGIRHGNGILIFPSGEKYVGEFKDGLYHGNGTHTLANGDRYNGEFIKGERNGNGTLLYKSGMKYIGEFIKGERNGNGILIWTCDEKYIGEFVDGFYHGNGILISDHDGEKYFGEFKRQSYCGNGTLIFLSGKKYVGEFNAGDYVVGTITFPSGQKYVGEFKNRQFNGKGTLTLPDGTKYVGEFSGGLFHGNGTLTFPDGDEYVGEFHEGNFVPLENLVLALSNKKISNSNDENNRTYLFFDTETTGLPKNYKAPVTDLNNWPRLVQIAFLLYDYYGKKILGGDYIIKPDGFSIPIEASRIHGITTERANREGKSLSEVLNQFYDLVEKADCIVAHNMQFDEKIVGAEFIRNNMHNNISAKSKICTMKSTSDFCGIKGPYGNKWPTLSELHNKLFGTGFEEAHNAAIDINATAKCFWELKRLGVFIS